MSPTVGVIGGGQLARMLALAAAPMGISVRVLASPSDEGAPEVVPDALIGGPMDPEAIRELAESCDVITIDHENVNLETLAELRSAGVAVAPSAGAIRFADKAHQRRSFAKEGLPVPEHLVLDESVENHHAAAADFCAEHGGSLVAKASTGGYDGRGVWKLAADGLDSFLDEYEGSPLVLEPELALERELAVVVARSAGGEIRSWPVVDTIQHEGMCRLVIMPADVPEPMATEAQLIAERVADLMGIVGILAVELFVVGGELLINEVAPRVHNSGHLTIDASETSQFQQHLRAILGWNLGPVGQLCEVAAMVNVVGGETVDPRQAQGATLAAVPGARIHLYGKQSRPKRKLGHVTVLGSDRAETVALAEAAASVLEGTASS